MDPKQVRGLVSTDECDSCSLAKAIISPFKSSTTESSHPLEHLDADLAGPFPGSKYLLVITDHYSRSAHSVPLKAKSEACEHIKSYIITTEKQFSDKGDYKVKIIHTANGGEFKSIEFEMWLKERGIIHTTTTAYTHKKIVELKE